MEASKVWCLDRCPPLTPREFSHRQSQATLIPKSSRNEDSYGDPSAEALATPAVLPEPIDAGLVRRVSAIYASHETQISELSKEISSLRARLEHEAQQRDQTFRALQELHSRLSSSEVDPDSADKTTSNAEDIIAAVGDLAKESEQVKGMLKTSVAWFRALTENSLDITAILDSGFVITYLTPSANRLLGLDADNLLGESLLDIVHAEDKSSVKQWLSNLVAGLPVDVPYTLRICGENGQYRVLEITGNNCVDLPAVGGIVINGRDITERAEAQAHIRHLAHHDELTGLPNRNLVRDRARTAMGRADREQTFVAIVFLDLDRFKHVNDSLGHQVGDRLLVEMARRLHTTVRQVDTVGRLGGDEFVLLLPDFKDPSEIAPLAEKLLSRIASSIVVDGHELHPSASMGVSVYPSDGTTLEALMRNADTAMYHAKAAGRNGYRFFTEAMNHAAQTRLQLETRLRRAIRDHEFLLYYQPIVSAQSGELIGAEALIRWLDPEYGMVPPNDFISVAEDLGLINELGAWVLQEACRQNRLWRDAGVIEIPIAVNLSAEQFRTDEIIHVVADALAAERLHPKWLHLEITESLLMQHTEQTIRLLTELNQLGVRLSIDDFGTGYSSLSYLTRFPIHKLKIDRAFLRDVHINTSNAAIANAVIAMAHSLNLKVLAEGVETQEQLDFLRQRGCDELQGFYFSRPISPIDFEKLAAAWRARQSA